MTSASVVIATFNRAELLDDCLSYLARQAFSGFDEVLVADNGSTDHTSAVVARHSGRFPVPLVRLLVPTPGKSHAVAAALEVAHGDIIAFTDDDVRVPAEWLATLRRAFDDPRTAIAGGPVSPRWQRPAPTWLQLAGQERLGAPLGLLDYGSREVRLGPRTLLGANLAVRRSVLQQLGGYATHLGKLRGTLLSGEDHELCHRVQAAGYDARYLPSARVEHWVPADRMTLRYFVRWFYWSGITHAAMDAPEARSHATRGTAGRFVRQFGAGLMSACAAAARGRKAAAVNRALDSAFAAGYAARRWQMAHSSSARATRHA